MAINISDKLLDTTIESKLELISYFIELAKKGKSNRQSSDLILNSINAKLNLSYYKDYEVIGPKYALGCLIGRFLYIYLKSENRTQQIELLTQLAGYLKELKPSSRPLLKKTTAIKLLKVIEDFGFPKSCWRLRTMQPLLIHIIPFEINNLNAAYYPYINSIASYRVGTCEEGSTPEYIFVHEVGHLLLYIITGNPEKVPDSFVTFNEKFRPNYNGDLLEIFVDLFSLAVMKDTEYAHLNPFMAVFSIDDQKLISSYFSKLVRKQFKNFNPESKS
jgi:hypothetical protein